jgi:hypothetical protein
MSLSAYKTVRDDHEDRQDGRLLALETTGAGDEARLLSLESKTQHMEPQPDHTRHGRRLQATDRITVDSISDLAHATLEAISANTHDASLRLIRGTTGSETVLNHEAGGNTTLSVAGNTVLSVSQASGGTTVGSGVGVTLSGNAVVQPDASIATLTLIGPTNTEARKTTIPFLPLQSGSRAVRTISVSVSATTARPTKGSSSRMTASRPTFRHPTRQLLNGREGAICCR